jgi:pyruvate formate lyase activating enzyme
MWRPAGDDGTAECLLCARACRIPPGRTGFCQVRLNHEGELRTLNYGFTGALALDPVEKKPLYHFRPGTLTFSVGAPGCNLDCQGCQNHGLSRPGPDFAPVEAPADLAARLGQAAQAQGADSWSFTYSEPTVFFEYAQDLAAEAAKAGRPTIWVTNGEMSPQVLKSLDVAAMNIDLKGFTEDFYRQVTGGRLAPVLDNIETALSRGVWVEVTTLLIPGLNDDPATLKRLAAWLAGLGRDVPWHVSRFFPRRRQSSLPPTPLKSLQLAREIGLSEGLNHVYLGNAPGFSDTLCPGCGHALVARDGYRLGLDLLSGRGVCPACGRPTAGRWT